MSSTMILMTGAILMAANPWPGWQWEEWRSVTGAEKPALITPQVGTMDLVPLMRTDDGGQVQTIKDWETKRDRILSTLEAILGEPTPFQKVPALAEMLGEEDLGDYVRRHVRIATEPDDWVPAFLLLPKPLPTEPTPTMLVIHQTVPQGKEEPCGIKGSPELAFAVELVKRGFVCLAPDMIGFGERIPEGANPYAGALEFYRKHPKWSFFGKMAWDISRIMDWLETLPEVDPRRIGSIGHSHGAYTTIMATIHEPRISAAVASCGFNTLRTDPSPNRWCHLTSLMPRVGFYVEDIRAAPFDWHEIVACIAPRPYFNWATLADGVFPNTENLEGIFSELKQVYGLYGAADNLEPNLVPGAHSFPADGRNKAYNWLKAHLPARTEALRFGQSVIPPVEEAARASLRKEWERRRGEIRQLLIRDIGPVEPPEWTPSHQVVEQSEREGFLEKKIRYVIPGGETVAAYLLLPSTDGTSLPGMLVFHQTVPEGKEEPAGRSGRASLQFGPELARRGYLVLIPDSITAGERVYPEGAFHTEAFYRLHPNLSALGKMIRDGRLAITLLQSVPGVDPARIGAMGHSLGAEEALFVAAFDERVKVSVASCGFAPFATEANLERWARPEWFSYIPRLRADLRAGWLPAWDFEDVIRLVAPRGYFNYQTSGDEIFPEAAAIHPLVEATCPIWKLYGAEGRLRSRLDPGKHDLPDSARGEIYDWLDGILK
ncbi:MAG: dienelactone hydrolase family protein [Candidatus Omnitrophica bacterium]|nr:dienelactone hydrolase family protein [Candidatus Omnitrophota bacterium]